MKKSTSIFFAVVITICLVETDCFAGNNKYLNRILKKYDLPASVSDSDNPEQFWDKTWRANEELIDYFKAAQKGTKVYKESSDLLHWSYNYSYEYYDNLRLYEDLEELCQRLLDDLGISGIRSDIRIQIVLDDEVNAFCIPDGRIYINTGLLEQEWLTYNGLLGIVAHETAHILLQHSPVSIYTEQKRLKTNKTLTTLANIAEIGSATLSGTTDPYVWNQIAQNTIARQRMLIFDANSFHYKYSREQEIEADLVAFRFLEFLHKGYGDYFIDVLKNLDDETQLFSSYDSDHPTTWFRISVIQYAISKDLKKAMKHRRNNYKK